MHRKVTEREIFNTHYLGKWEECFGIAKELCSTQQVNPEDIIQTTGQLFLGWVIGTDDIRSKKNSLQRQLNKLQSDTKGLKKKKKVEDKPF